MRLQTHAAPPPGNANLPIGEFLNEKLRLSLSKKASTKLHACNTKGHAIYPLANPEIGVPGTISVMRMSPEKEIPFP